LSAAAIAHGFAAVLAATVLALGAFTPVWRFVIWARMTLYIQPPDIVAITMTGIAFQTTFAIVAAIAALKLRRRGAAPSSLTAIFASVAGAAALLYSYAGLGGLVGMAGASLSLIGAGRAWAQLSPEHFNQPNSLVSKFGRRWILGTAILLGVVSILVLSLGLAEFAGAGRDGLFYAESAVAYLFSPILLLLARLRRAHAAAA